MSLATEYQNTLGYGMDHRNTILLPKILKHAIGFYLRNDTHNLYHLTVFIPKPVRP